MSKSITEKQKDISKIFLPKRRIDQYTSLAQGSQGMPRKPFYLINKPRLISGKKPLMKRCLRLLNSRHRLMVNHPKVKRKFPAT